MFEVVDFIREIRILTEPVTFEDEDILAGESRAAMVSPLQTRIKATGNITASQFAISSPSPMGSSAARA